MPQGERLIVAEDLDMHTWSMRRVGPYFMPTALPDTFACLGLAAEYYPPGISYREGGNVHQEGLRPSRARISTGSLLRGESIRNLPYDADVVRLFAFTAGADVELDVVVVGDALCVSRIDIRHVDEEIFT